MKKQKKDKRRQSTQNLLGIQKITDYCISTDAGDLVFYIIKPTNISVLPAGAVSAKIRALQNTLSAQAGVELLAMNSRESFNATCLFYHDRMQEEKNPAIREPARTGSCVSGRKAGADDAGAGVLSRRPTEKREAGHGVHACFPPSRQNSATTASPRAAPERKTSNACLPSISSRTPRRSASRTTTVSGSWRRSRWGFLERKTKTGRGNRESLKVVSGHDRAQHREI